MLPQVGCLRELTDTHEPGKGLLGNVDALFGRC